MHSRVQVFNHLLQVTQNIKLAGIHSVQIVHPVQRKLKFSFTVEVNRTSCVIQFVLRLLFQISTHLFEKMLVKIGLFNFCYDRNVNVFDSGKKSDDTEFSSITSQNYSDVISVIKKWQSLMTLSMKNTYIFNILN